MNNKYQLNLTVEQLAVIIEAARKLIHDLRVSEEIYDKNGIIKHRYSVLIDLINTIDPGYNLL